MIAFASLFLGLMVGVRPVALVVGGPVAAVAVELDGRLVGRLSASPWTVDVDFGPEFDPHELVARAFDEKGEEIARTRQWINLPRPPAEVEVVLERDAKGNAVAARLAWGSLVGPSPDKIAVSFDGKALPLQERRVLLPSYDSSATHVLTATLDFPNSVRSRTDVVIGGAAAGEAKSELTAVPVLFRERPPSKTDALRGRIQKNGEPLTIAAVEHGPAEILLVRDLESAEAIRRLRRVVGARVAPGGFGIPNLAQSNYQASATALDRQDRVRILWPVAKRFSDASAPSELFDASREFSGETADFRFLLTRVDYPLSAAGDSGRRYADAVAVAGLQAFGSYGRRAVVLVLGDGRRDESRYEPDSVRRYLARLHVPLYVWSLAESAGRSAAARWGEVADVSTSLSLEKAVDRLRRDLDRQSIVWVEGRHLPQDILVLDRGDGLVLAGDPVASSLRVR
jgi:hypothetical protein